MSQARSHGNRLTPEAELIINRLLFRWITRISSVLVVSLGIAGYFAYATFKDSAEIVAKEAATDTIKNFEKDFEGLQNRMDELYDKSQDARTESIREIVEAVAQVGIVRIQLKELQKEVNSGHSALKDAKELTRNIEVIVARIASSEKFQKAVSDSLVDFPLSGVVSFALDSCLDGWKEYTSAYGRFIRGVDRSGERIDPEGERIWGSIQGDGLGQHKHDYRGGATGRASADRGGDHPHVWKENEGRKKTADTGIGETRPKNVALLYCIKVGVSPSIE